MSPVRILAALVLLVVGASAALAAALVHQWWWGLGLGLVVAAIVTRALPAGISRIAFVLGWAGAIVYAVVPRAEGDYLIAASTSGYLLLGGSFVVFLAALNSLPASGARRGEPRRSAGS